MTSILPGVATLANAVFHSRALAHYRAREFDKAVQRLKESRKAAGDWGGPLNPYLLAQCYRALKQPDDVQVELHNLHVWINETDIFPWPFTRLLAGYWPPPTLALSDWLEYQLLRREVGKAFKPTTPGAAR
jgi:hypothetical protein